MKKGQIYEGIIERLDFPQKGYINYNEDGEIYKILVKGTIPGQKVRFILNKKRPGKCEGRLEEVIVPSELENVKPRCQHFGVCGGCTYQTMSYDNQLKIKSEQVKNIIDEVCSDYEYEGITGSPVEWNYRNKMEFSFGDEYKDGPLALGMHKKGSFHDIVTITDCQIVDDDYNKIIKVVLEHFTELNSKFFHKMTHIGYLRHLLLRRAVRTGEILINVLTSTQESDIERASYDRLKDKLLGLELSGNIKGIMHTYNDNLADVVKSDRMEILYGTDYIYEEILDLKFKISTFSFFQTNSLGAEVLYRKAREYVGETKDKVVFDLYSGTGTIAQMLAPVAAKVVGVEIIEEAVEAAKTNAKLNGLKNCEFIAGDVLKVIDSITDKPDLIVLDPPRDGINPKALSKIIDYNVDRIVYISCKPTSLARDLIMLQERGYKLEKVACVDMFPETGHVETVCLLSKK